MNKFLYSGIFLLVTCFMSVAEAAITSTTMTPAPPATLSNGKPYYCAGTLYTFRIQSTDPAATGAGYWTTAVVQFRDNGVVHHNFTINISDFSSMTATVQNGVVVTNIQNLSGNYTAVDVQVTLRFLWDSGTYTPFNADNNNDVRLAVTNSSGSGIDIRTFYYGVISQIQVLSFAQNLDAADGRVNPWHDGFTISGRIAYFFTGETISTLVPVGEISGLTLFRQGGTVPAGPSVIFSGANNNFQYAVPDEYFAFGAATAATATTGAYSWSVSAVMTSSGETETATGTLGIDVGMVSVSAGGLTFVNGGGVNAPYYVRSVNVSGTEIRIATTAAMVGTVTFAVQDSLGNNYTLQVANGATSGTVLLGATPNAAQVPAGNNTNVTYTVGAVTGGAYGNVNTATGQVSSARILNSTGYACRWENGHWPGYGSTPFTAEVPPPSSTATSFTLRWTPLSTANAAPYDADFYTYRVYFKKDSDPASAWVMLDRSNAPALGVIGTTAFTVGGAANPLEPLTLYNFRISAIDVFGNEVPYAPTSYQITGNVTTSALTVEASITDGVSMFGNDSFGVPLVDPPPTNPAAHGVRKTAIKVTVYLVTAGTVPEQVNIIIANNNSDLPAQFGLPAGANDDIVTLTEGVDRWTIPCSKVTANTYQAFIPSGHPLMAMNTNIRFIISSVIGGATSYYDHTPDVAPPGDHQADEWRFRVSKKALFIPYPTRILNNVLTAQMPCCYPAFFLAVDSLVTIKVYDAKGRVIATLCDRLYRPGGQNIKDLGWCGRSKDYARVGPGLYYIHINAVTLGNKTVLDKKMKVVVAH